jgi:hypothetical protein
MDERINGGMMNPYEQLKKKVQEANPAKMFFDEECPICGAKGNYRLADVLFAIYRTLDHVDLEKLNIEIKWVLFHWSCTDDSLDNQSQELKDFLVKYLAS